MMLTCACGVGSSGSSSERDGEEREQKRPESCVEQ